MKTLSLLLLISSFTLAQDEPDYVCKFVEPLKKVNAEEWKIKITGDKGDGSACIGKGFCEWNFAKRLPPSSWYRTPKRYEEGVVCTTEKDGTCKKSYKACGEDERASFADENIPKQRLKIKSADEIEALQ